MLCMDRGNSASSTHRAGPNTSRKVPKRVLMYKYLIFFLLKSKKSYYISFIFYYSVFLLS